MKSPTSRTTLLTSVAVAGVLIAGAAAVSANMGILDASNDSPIGELDATDDLLPSTTLDPGVPMVVKIAETQEPTTTVAKQASYAVDVAGTVSVTAVEGVLTLVNALDNLGWSHTVVQPNSLSLQVEFTDGTRTFIFAATLDADGDIDAEVTEPVIVVGAAPNSPVAAPVTPSYDDDQYDDDQYESDDDEYESDDDDDESDDDEYESDDDEHEYEGADDDD